LEYSTSAAATNTAATAAAILLSTTIPTIMIKMHLTAHLIFLYMTMIKIYTYYGL
jgi:hypothetical protein